MSKTGLLLSIDGLDGTGKTTQIGFIKTYFENKGKSVTVFREIDCNDLTRQLGALLLTPTEYPRNKETDFFIVAALRQEAQNTIKYLLGEYDVVILDRYVHSTLAIQCYSEYRLNGYSMGVQRIRDQGVVYTDGSIFLLSDNYQMLAERIGSRGQALDRVEERPANQQSLIYEGYLQCARMTPFVKDNNVKVVNIQPNQGPEEVFHSYTDFLGAFTFTEE